MSSFYSKDEVESLGFAKIGNNVLISRKASIYSAEQITIGNNVRIDDFCILSGKIDICNNVHIAAGCYLFAGSAGIIFHDYTTLSSRCCVYAISDDYSGNHMTNPMIPSEFRCVEEAPVHIKRHVIVGTGSTILPGVVIAEGCSVGSMSLVSKSTEPWGIYVGIPCKRLKERNQELLVLERKFLERRLK